MTQKLSLAEEAYITENSTKTKWLNTIELSQQLKLPLETLFIYRISLLGEKAFQNLDKDYRQFKTDIKKMEKLKKELQINLEELRKYPTNQALPKIEKTEETKLTGKQHLKPWAEAEWMKNISEQISIIFVLQAICNIRCNSCKQLVNGTNEVFYLNKVTKKLELQTSCPKCHCLWDWKNQKLPIHIEFEFDKIRDDEINVEKFQLHGIKDVSFNLLKLTVLIQSWHAAFEGYLDKMRSEFE